MDCLTIPNILTCIRLALMPVFLGVYFSGAENAKTLAMCVLVVSFLTDVLDGFIARKFNMISNAGKVLDPLADKIMQISVLVCIAVNHRGLLWLVMVMLAKDVLMGAGAIWIYVYHKKIIPANWFGKVSCFVSVLCSLILIFTDAQNSIQYFCASAIAVVNLVAFVSYTYESFAAKKEPKKV